MIIHTEKLQKSSKLARGPPFGTRGAEHCTPSRNAPFRPLRVAVPSFLFLGETMFHGTSPSCDGGAAVSEAEPLQAAVVAKAATPPPAIMPVVDLQHDEEVHETLMRVHNCYEPRQLNRQSTKNPRAAEQIQEASRAAVARMMKEKTNGSVSEDSKSSISKSNFIEDPRRTSRMRNPRAPAQVEDARRTAVARMISEKGNHSVSPQVLIRRISKSKLVDGPRASPMRDVMNPPPSKPKAIAADRCVAPDPDGFANKNSSAA